MFYIGFETSTRPASAWPAPGTGDELAASPANPVIRPGKGKWDGDAVYKPYAILDGKRWLLWYNGRKGGVEQIGVAFHKGEGLGF